MSVRLADALRRHGDFEVLTQSLSITTFRYVPPDARPVLETSEPALEELNRRILTRLNAEGTYYLSNAIIRGRFYLRACVVNFRTSLAIMEGLPEHVATLGRELHRAP